MRWKDREQSSNVEDRRGQRVGGSGHAAGLVGGLGIGRMLLGLFMRGSMKTRLLMIIALAVGFFLFKGQLLQILGFSGGFPSSQLRTEQVSAPPNDEMKAFLSVMMRDNEEVWQTLLQKQNIRFKPASMVIYTERTITKGGIADAKMGPFYLPIEGRIYIDPSFFTEMKEKFGATGDFAEVYVIAHEYGHHIQNLLGRTTALHSKHGKIPQNEYNRESVRLELHADFLAGVFAKHASGSFQNYLEDGDVEEAIRCAKAIGDDRLQQQAQGHVQPDSFTHGTSEQRAKWFNMGYRTGDLSLGDKIFTMPYSQL